MATWIHADGRIETVTPVDGRTFTLAELQRMVGGYIELVPGPVDRTSGRASLMFCNEEGKLKGLPLNHEATVRVRHWLGAGDVIVGDVVLCSWAEAEGDGDEAEATE